MVNTHADASFEWASRAETSPLSPHEAGSPQTLVNTASARASLRFGRIQHFFSQFSGLRK